MPAITRIAVTKNRPSARIFLDGEFAFTCHNKIVDHFKLMPGVEITPEFRAEIEFRESRRQCIEQAMRFIVRRSHSRAELLAKLRRRQWPPGILDAAMAELARLGCLNDAQFARDKAENSVNRRIGPVRLSAELRLAGVSKEAAAEAVRDAYEQSNPAEIARDLARRRLPRLRDLDHQVARRRLAGLLARRGFESEMVFAIVEEFLGRE